MPPVSGVRWTILIQTGECIAQGTCSVALLCGIPLCAYMVGLVDILSAGCEPVDDLEEQFSVVAHVLAVAGLCVVVELVEYIGSRVDQSFAVPYIIVVVAVEPSVELAA